MVPWTSAGIGQPYSHLAAIGSSLYWNGSEAAVTGVGGGRAGRARRSLLSTLTLPEGSSSGLTNSAPPKDLGDVLAKVALASPEVVTLRSLSQRWSKALATAPLLSAAAWVAMGFRALFNLPETTLMLRGLNSAEPYWERVLGHIIDGNLQAVADEYVQVLVELVGLESGGFDVATEVAENIHEAVELRTSVLR